jgi:FkbM family methyltransferase
MKRLLQKVVPQFVKRRLTALAWKRLSLSVELRSGLIVDIKQMGDWWIYNDLWVNGEYDFAIDLALSGRPTDRPLQVLDLGANVGMFALRLFDVMHQRQVPYDVAKVLMIEGSATSCQELLARFQKQNIPTDAYRVVHGLVGKRAGSAYLDESGVSAQSTLGSAGTQVEYVDVSKLMQGPIDLLKCDIEGSEHEFLVEYPELLERVRVAVFELHPWLCDVSHCQELLSTFSSRRLLRTREDLIVESYWR